MFFLYNGIKAIDQFGAPIVLNYKQKTSLKTHLGGILTFLMSGVGLFLVYYFGKEIITKEKPMILYSKIRRNNSEVFLKDFPIFFAIGHPNGQTMKSSLVDTLMMFQVTQYVFNVNQTLFLQNVTVVRCDAEKHFGKYKSLIDIYSGGITYEDYYCPDFDNNTKFRNDYVTTNSSLFRIQVLTCNNKTANRVCAPVEDQKKYLNEFYVKNYFMNYYIDTSLAENQETLFLDSYTQQNGLLLSKKIFFRFKTTEIKVDNGWIMEESMTRSLLQLDSIVPDTNLNEVNSDIKYVMLFESPRLGDFYSISYIKIQNIIGNLGGILNVLMVIGKIACSYVSETSFYLQQTKDLVHLQNHDNNDSRFDDDELNKPSTISIIPFSKDDKNGSKLKSNELVIGVSPMMELKKRNEVEATITPVTIKKDSQKPLSNTTNNYKIEKKQVHIKIPKSQIGFCSYLKVCCSCNKDSNDNFKLFYEAIFDFFEKQLDITGIIKTRHELEIVKSIFLTHKEENKELFNFKIPLEEILLKYEINKKKELEEEEKAKLEMNSSVNKGKLEEEEKIELEKQNTIKKKLSLIQQKTIKNIDN